MSSFFLDEVPEPLKIPDYIPDQELYPGKVFHSFAEMKAACPKLDEKKEEMERKRIPYTSYVCRFQEGF